MISLSLILNACARVELKDWEICGDAGPNGAFCFHTISDEERAIPKAKWDTERFGMLCMNASAFAELKAAILKLCKESRLCKYEEVETELLRYEKKILNNKKYLHSSPRH